MASRDAIIAVVEPHCHPPKVGLPHRRDTVSTAGVKASRCPRTLTERGRQHSWSERHLQQLALHSQELERLSFEDSLTAIANRRRFEQQLASALADGPDPQYPVCVTLIDLDEFKRINDTYSHAAGDDVLRSVAQAIKAAVRESDLPARYGGDEFVVLFSRTTLDMAQQVCGRIQTAVAELHWERWSPALQVSVSIGVSQAQPGDTGASLLQRSDVAMFGDKTNG